MLFEQMPEPQSAPARQALPIAHRAHELGPPQSTSVSVPSFTLSAHWFTHTPPAWQMPVAPMQACPAVTLPHTPFWPPVNAARQL